MRKQFVNFLVRWAANTLGLYIAGDLLGLLSYADDLLNVVLGGLLLAVLNAILKPFIVTFTLPAIALTRGLFLIVVNGFVVYLAAFLYGPLQVASIGMAVLAGMVVGLVNYSVNIVLEARS